MFIRRHLCSDCKTGKESMEIDCRSPMCPYIGSRTRKHCACYVSLKDSLLKKFFDKVLKKCKKS